MQKIAGFVSVAALSSTVAVGALLGLGGGATASASHFSPAGSGVVLADGGSATDPSGPTTAPTTAPTPAPSPSHNAGPDTWGWG